MEQKKRKKRRKSVPDSEKLDKKLRKQSEHRQSEPAVSTQGLKLEKSKRRKSQPDAKKVTKTGNDEKTGKTISLTGRELSTLVAFIWHVALFAFLSLVILKLM